MTVTPRTAPAPEPAPALKHDLPVLDTLRGIGALAVLTTHAAFQGGEYLRHGVWGTLLARLDVGVAIFFVLSGFLLARPWLSLAASGRARPSVTRYYEKRLLRIYPVYLVTVVIALGWIRENSDAGLRTWVSSLLLADSYTKERLPQGLTQMWSLTAEVAFYAVLPLLMALAVGRGRELRPRRVIGVVLGMTMTSAIWILLVADPLQEVTWGVPSLWIPAFATWFALGIALALVHVLQTEGRLSPTLQPLIDLARMPGVCWAIIAGLMLVAATPVAGPIMFQIGSHAQILTKHLLYAVIGAIIVLTGVFADPVGRYSRAMTTRPLRHFGKISYGFFCIHLSVLALIYAVTDYTVFAGDTLQVWFLALVLSIAASELLYWAIEFPVSRFADRLRRADSRASTPISTEHAASTR